MQKIDSSCFVMRVVSSERILIFSETKLNRTTLKCRV